MSLNISGLGNKFNIDRSVINSNPVSKDTRINTPKLNSSGKDIFQRNSYVTVPKRNIINSQNQVANIYSPKQLLKAYLNTDYINFLIDTNPNIKNILDENNLDTNVNTKNVSNIINSHLTTTTSYAMQIANKLNISQSDKQILEQACVFHDFGKVLIPTDIINKSDSLNEDERKIMDLHSDLGYELLSSTGLNQKVLNLVKNHHNSTADNADILTQILSVADIYSALREERSYKTSLSKQEALDILNQKAIEGEVSAEVVEALKESVLSA